MAEDVPQRPREHSGQQPRWELLVTRPDLIGLALSAWLFAQSLGPSLLARSWLFQGVLAGVAIAVGYGLGRGAAWLGAAGWRHTGRPPPLSAEQARRLRVVVVVVLLAYLGWSVARAVPQHRWTWDRLGYERSSFWYVYGGTLLLALAVAGLLLGTGALLRLLWVRTTRLGSRVLPVRVAGGLALLLLGWVVLASLNTFVLQRTLAAANEAFAGRDRDLADAPQRTESRWRSTGPGSAVDWQDVGLEGRRFLTRGPDAAGIAGLTGVDPGAESGGGVREPIRVFVGRASAETVRQRVAIAMAELDRLGAFERAAVLVAVPTGTGWVNEQIVQPLEYLHEGDVATVAVQYSHLPSPLAFVAESSAAGDTAVALLEAVEARVEQQGDRAPHLYVAGESLGSFGGASAFGSLADSRERTDGAVWVGPPETMHLRREAERTRRPGSLQISPVVGDGEAYLFVNRPGDLAGRRAAAVHSVFLQQADDPIVWWDWDLLLREPDWLAEPLDPAVNPDMRWAPVVTYLHLAVDMAVANDFDEDHGHLYGTQPLLAWQAVLGPSGWEADDLERLRRRLSGVSR